MIAFNVTRGRRLAEKVGKADQPASRARGLLGRDGLEPGEGLWIVPCAMIHTFFMRFSLDVVFLDKELRVVKAIEGLKPWRLSPWVWGAHSVLELAAGALGGQAQPGDRVEMRPS